MIRNYLTIALRNMRRYRLVSSINLLGLSVGISCCLLILLYVIHEMSYDRYGNGSDNTYRITRAFLNNDGSENLHLSAIAPAFGPRLLTDFPQIEKMARLLSNGATTIKKDEKLFNEEDAFFADENFFDVFPVPVIKGNHKSLKDPQNIMLSEKIAEKYFGQEDPINKVIKVDNQYLYKVTGVFKEFPAASHMHPQILLSFPTLKDSTIYGENQLNTSYSNNAFYTYIRLRDENTAKKLQEQFPAFIDKHMGGFVPAGVKMSKYTTLSLQKVKEIHLTSHLDDELEANGDIKRVYIFSCVAIFILLLACINYMNLSTARSLIRAKEIGIRKAIGAQRKELIIQFLSESVVITFISTVIALILTYILLPAINRISGQHLEIAGLLHLRTLFILLLLPLVLGVLSGLYPALFMSGFNTIKVLKGFFRIENKSISFKKILVVSQFAVSIILIVVTFVVFRQLDFMQNSSLGYNKEHVITTTFFQPLANSYKSFRTELLSDPSIKEVGRSSRIPTGRLLDDLGGASVQTGDSMVKQPGVSLKFIRTDHYFVPAFDVEVIAGRNFSENFNDSANFMLNATAVRNLGITSAEEAVGKRIRYGQVTGNVVGVLKDFHFESMHERILPLIFLYDANSSYNNIIIKTTNPHAAIAALEKTWALHLPDIPLQFSFMEENVAALYETERQQQNLFTVFSIIAIFIACLGLFGLSAFTIGQRIKEIGIRKVLGASLSGIVSLLTLDFLKLVLIAPLIALPIAWYLINLWLQDFAYRISVPWWILVASPVLAVLVAFVTIGSQAYKAANSNPVNSLRTE